MNIPPKFITNQNDFLSDIIERIIPCTNQIDMLVGYFYFSGYMQLADKLDDKKIRILVGMDVDTQIANRVREVEDLTAWKNNPSRNQIREDYFNGLVKLINDSDNSDSDEAIILFRKFQKKIYDGSLAIKRTEDPCHAKMYLFHYNDIVSQGGDHPGCVITGSSNLSYQGLKGRLEINARFDDPQTFTEGKEIFENLWENAVSIVDGSSIDQWKKKVVQKVWIDRLFNPYQMYLRVLHEYFTIPSAENILTPHDITHGKFVNLKYQTDAVRLALKSIETHNGVIIADVVGLGKSIIASTIARNLSLRTIVVSPPHLKTGWETYKMDFAFNGTIFSGGKIKEALDYYNCIKSNEEQFLIIIDEAHRYRNEYTEDYALLHNLCQGNKVILLTATPFNNDPADIYSMLKLFQIPTKSTLKTVENLSLEFRDLIIKYKTLREDQRKGHKSKEEISLEAKKIAGKIRSIIGPLVIRRSRIDLQQIEAYRDDLKTQKIEIVIPDDPIEQGYNLGDLEAKYLETLDLIYGTRFDEDGNPKTDDGKYRFKAARYKPITYVPQDKMDELAKDIERQTGIDDVNMLIGRQSNVARFMRKMLVSRFESSVAAFKSSLDFMIRSSENIIEWADTAHAIPVWKKGGLPDVDDFYESEDDNMQEIEEIFEKYRGTGFFIIPTKFINDDFFDDVRKDIKLLKSIRQSWFGEEDLIRYDPKLKSFIELVTEMLDKEPERKIVVFSEYADTVNYLGNALKEAGLPVLSYTSSDASVAKRDEINKNFDASIKPELQQDKYKILIATDAISEGYNLHRAGAVFNYDIPYNPTRVIQRIGRINRINRKVFDKLFIFNYFPTNVGEKETRTKEISTLKMAMIHAIMGEDTKALTSDEECTAFFRDRYRKEIEKSETQSWDTPYRQLLDSMQGTVTMAEALSIPHRARTGRNVEKPIKGIILFGKKGDDFVFKISDGSSDPLMLTTEEAFTLFSASSDEKPVPITENFDVLYQRVKSSLFKNNTLDRNDQNILKALQKVQALKDYLNEDYYKDLIRALTAEALSGHEVRFITKLKKAEIDTLYQEITPDYLVRILNTESKIEEGDELLILSEQIQ